MRYICSDLHIGHNNIAKFRDMGMTSEEHWEAAFEGIERLPKRATLFLLGDIIVDKKYLDRMKKVQCENKILILGNHDNEKSRGINMKDLVRVYDQVYSLHKYKKFWMSHAPIHPMELRGKSCLHGHTHPYLMLNEDGTQDTRFINCCAEYASYTPISFEYSTSEEYQQECWKKWKEDYEPKWGNKP